MTGDLVAFFAIAGALAAVLALISIWSPRRVWTKVTALVTTALFLPVAYISLVDMLSRPKPVDMEWLNANATSAAVLGAQMIEDERSEERTSPSTVTSFNPGEVVISGALLDTVTSVTVGGVPISFSTAGSGTLLFTPPSPFDIGTHEVRISNSAGSTTANLTVAGNHPSLMKPPSFVVGRGVPETYTVHTDRSWQVLLVVSTSQVPSVIPGTVALGLGNNFGDFIAIPLFADTRGTAEITLTFPAFIPPALITYWQAVTCDPGNVTFPLETSDVITVFLF